MGQKDRAVPKLHRTEFHMYASESILAQCRREKGV